MIDYRRYPAKEAREYLLAAAMLTGYLNRKAWRGYAPKALQFVGVEGGRESEGYVLARLHFDVVADRPPIVVATKLTPSERVDPAKTWDTADFGPLSKGEQATAADWRAIEERAGRGKDKANA